MTQSVNQPNLLYIHSDQHAAAVTGCYGDQLDHTPNLKKFSAEVIGVNIDLNLFGIVEGLVIWRN